MLVVDAAKCVWKSHEIFDAIVTDRKTLHVTILTSTAIRYPFLSLSISIDTAPYGIREGARKIGVKKGPTKSVSPEM